MAREKKKEGVFVDKPKPDVYLALLILTFVAMLVATGIMFYENSLLQ